MDQRSHKNVPGPDFKTSCSETTQWHAEQHCQVPKAGNDIHPLNATSCISHQSQIAKASDPKHRDISHISTARQHESDTKNASDDNLPHTMAFIRYLAPQKMVTSGLLQFHNRPESYKAVRRSPRSCTKGPHLRHREEIDPLIERLSREFVKHSKSWLFI